MKSRSINTGILALAVAFGVGIQAQAKTDVGEKVDQLKENTENSKSNLKQYEEGYDTVTSNLGETQKATATLEKEAKVLAKQISESQKGKAGIAQVQKQIDGLIDSEKQKMTTEKKQLADLENAVATVQENLKKRQENVASYEEKKAKVASDMASWNERNQSIVELETALKTKLTQAKAETQRLTAKKASYEDEIAKWKKEVRVSERDYQNYSKLKD